MTGTIIMLLLSYTNQFAACFFRLLHCQQISSKWWWNKSLAAILTQWRLTGLKRVQILVQLQWTFSLRLKRWRRKVKFGSGKREATGKKHRLMLICFRNLDCVVLWHDEFIYLEVLTFISMYKCESYDLSGLFRHQMLLSSVKFICMHNNRIVVKIWRNPIWLLPELGIIHIFPSKLSRKRCKFLV